MNDLDEVLKEQKKELKELDLQLSDSQKYKELSSQAGFFDGYKQKQEELSVLMQEWEENLQLSEKLQIKKDQVDGA